MPESELLNHFQCEIQCLLSNSENDNTNMKIILCKGKLSWKYISGMWKREILNFDVVLAVTKSTVLCNRCTSNTGSFSDHRFSTISTYFLHIKELSMIISESHFAVAILVMQQSFLWMEIKSIQKNLLI